MDSDYIYRPKKNPTQNEINAVQELSKLPTLKSVLINLATLMAFRPMLNASGNQCELVMSDIANKIIREKYSEASVIWAIEKLKDGNAEFGGRNFPTRHEIISEIQFGERKIDLIIRAFSNESGKIPEDYHFDRSVDIVFDELDKNSNVAA